MMAVNKLCDQLEVEHQRVIDQYIDLRTHRKTSTNFSTASAEALVEVSKAFQHFGVVSRGIVLDREVRRFKTRRGF